MLVEFAMGRISNVVSVRPLPPALAEKARVELNENAKTLKHDLQNVKEWIVKHPHLKARTDDQWILAFLRGCKFSLEKTKEKLDCYYSCRSTAPELFRIKHTDPLFDKILSLGSFVVLPKVGGPDSPRICWVRPGNFDPKEYHILDILAVSNVILKILLLEDDHATVAGVQTILDLEGVSMGHFLQMTPLTIKKLMVMSQDASPLRMKGTHYLNTPPGFETIFNMMKSMMSEKNKSKLFVHNKNYEAMYHHIPQDVLPKMYGGTGPNTEQITEYWRTKVREMSSWLEEDEAYGTNEEKRPGKPWTAEKTFGTEGSFKPLDID